VEITAGLDETIEAMREATRAFVNGDTSKWFALCSREADATLFGGWGGHERGWDELGPRYEWASSRFGGGEVTFEELARYGSGELACTVHLEHYATYVPERDEAANLTLRVTHVYRLEDGRWRLLHRHGDHAAEVWV
jgi:ketosteroid isomerase-like protein